ncbi:Uncharacterized protein FKW44_019980, partial [Caligus rogercresseyi]
RRGDEEKAVVVPTTRKTTKKTFEAEDPIDEYIDRMVFQNIDTPLRSAIQVVDPAIMHPIPLCPRPPSHPLLMVRSTLETGGAAPPRNNPAAPNSSSRALPRHAGKHHPKTLLPNQLQSQQHSGAAAPTIHPHRPYYKTSWGEPPTHKNSFTFDSEEAGQPLMMDVVGLSLLDSMDNDMPDLDSANLSSGGRAALSSIPSALLRWNEESRVIDGESMHDCVTNLSRISWRSSRPLARKTGKERRTEEMIKKLMIDSGNNGEDTEEEGARDPPICSPTLRDHQTTSTERTVSPPPPSSSEEDSVPSSGRQAISQLAQDLAAAISTRVGSLPAIRTGNNSPCGTKTLRPTHGDCKLPKHSCQPSSSTLDPLLTFPWNSPPLLESRAKHVHFWETSHPEEVDPSFLRSLTTRGAYKTSDREHNSKTQRALTSP